MINKKYVSFLLLAGFLLSAVPVFSEATSSTSTLECIRAAVSTREQALGTAVADYTRSVGIAYADRANSLQLAYTSTAGNNEIKSKVKTSWTNFDVFIKSVKNKLSIAKNDAWSKYRSSFKACKGASAISDSSNSGKEI